jgi:hypothetical protein
VRRSSVPPPLSASAKPRDYSSQITTLPCLSLSWLTRHESDLELHIFLDNGKDVCFGDFQVRLLPRSLYVRHAR